MIFQAFTAMVIVMTVVIIITHPRGMNYDSDHSHLTNLLYVIGGTYTVMDAWIVILT